MTTFTKALRSILVSQVLALAALFSGCGAVADVPDNVDAAPMMNATTSAEIAPNDGGVDASADLKRDGVVESQNTCASVGKFGSVCTATHR